ncbi:unnamed protein product [Protopolystoma xenopodis]|uniref:Uncharacterized protein n=1 Tax=Protopolystoma xenopodis TaxID=117903 RepID=A0A448WWU1_9PLAT|nr:unnamed protein product [Protopolystoma xenopodis]
MSIFWTQVNCRRNHLSRKLNTDSSTSLCSASGAGTGGLGGHTVSPSCNSRQLVRAAPIHAANTTATSCHLFGHVMGAIRGERRGSSSGIGAKSCTSNGECNQQGAMETSSSTARISCLATAAALGNGTQSAVFRSSTINTTSSVSNCNLAIAMTAKEPIQANSQDSPQSFREVDSPHPLSASARSFHGIQCANSCGMSTVGADFSDKRRITESISRKARSPASVGDFITSSPDQSRLPAATLQSDQNAGPFSRRLTPGTQKESGRNGCSKCYGEKIHML